MPELPDLEVFKVNIFKRLTSKQLAGIEVFNPAKVLATKEFLINNFVGKNLLSIDRLGKELLFNFGDNRVIAAHLMLSGKISIVSEDTVNAIKFKIFSMSFEQETIVFSDMGGLCTIKLPVPGKAPDAFADTLTLEYFLDIARKKSRSNVKAFLIDQSIVKGIGNAYVDEILWAARISPLSLIGKIPEDKLAILYQSIGTVLSDAIASIKRISPDIISGEERSFLKVHNKAIKETETGYPIIVEKIASKITYHTKEQVVYS
ncbi:MAG: hypothetical protein FWD44_04745 [Oscillospiraceae bacterium]|nr:hypothetical protein [Oscillospiraceae bacterium]